MTTDHDQYTEWFKTQPDAPRPQTARTVEQPEPASDYGAWFEAERAAADEKAAAAIEHTRPMAAKLLDAEARSARAADGGVNVPARLLEDEQSELSQRIEAADRRKKLMGSTKLAEWIVADPVNAAVANADLQNLSTIAGLAHSLGRGAYRVTAGGVATLGEIRAQDRLDRQRQVYEDSKATFGSLMDDVRAAVDEQDKADAEDGIVNIDPRPLRVLAGTAARYLRSRLVFTGDETQQKHLDSLERDLEDAMTARVGTERNAEKFFGRSARVGRVNDAIAAIKDGDGSATAKLSEFGAMAVSDPGAMSEWLLNVVVESAPTLVAAVGTTVATRSPTAGAVVLGAGSFDAAGVSAYAEEIKRSGYDLTDAEQRAAFIADPDTRALIRSRAGAYATVVAIMDGLSGGVASQTLAKSPAGDLVLQGLAQAALGGGGEFLGQVAADRDIDLIDVAVEALAELTTAPVEVAGVGARRFGQRRSVAQDRSFFRALQAGENSEARKRTPRKYREAIAALTADGPVENVYVDAQAFDGLFQSANDGTTAEAYLGTLTGVDIEAYRTARETGGAFAIPTAVYATDIVGTDFDAKLRDHLKTNPEHLSAAEARSYRDQQQELLTAAQKTLDEIESGQTELERVAENARADLVSDLRRAGQRTEVAEKNALLSVSVARTLAQRSGMSLPEFLARYPLPRIDSALHAAAYGDDNRDAVIGDIETGISDSFLRRPGWGILTATRPGEDNDARNAELEARLREQGIPFVPVEGVYKGEPDGRSFMVFADREAVVALGAAYDQDSVLTREGLIYPDGRPATAIDPDQVVTGDAARERDFYTVMPDGSAWSVGFSEPLQQGGRNGREARRSVGSETPLPGAPNVEGASGPDARLVAAAEDYATRAGLTIRRQSEFAQVDPEFAARVADAYEAMEHAPGDPAVAAAYAELAAQTRAQYDVLVEHGYSFSFFDETNDPYDGNPWNAMRDLRANKRMAVYATEAGFGSSDLDVADNPLLADTGLEWPMGPDGQMKRVLVNDLFRAVHDAFGHGIEGAGFRARGEENAWQAHVRLFYGAAVGALTSETRGQNSWLNYGPHGETNRTAQVEDTVFADQKTGLMPEWTWTDNRVGDAPEVVVLTHWSNAPRETLDPAFAGTGPLRGGERARAGRPMVYYGRNVGKPGGYVKEHLGRFRHEVRVPATALYDLTADPDKLMDAAEAALRHPRFPGLHISTSEKREWAVEEIARRGYLGYTRDDAQLGDVAALFEAQRPDSVTEESGVRLFQSGAEPAFFSALTREVENAKQKTATARDWMAIIAKLPGVKKAEIEWSGVEDWLFAQEGQIPREAVAAYLRENEVVLDVQVLTEDAESMADDFEESVVEEDPLYLDEQGWGAYGDDLISDALDREADNFVDEFGDTAEEELGEYYDPSELRAVAREYAEELYDGRSLDDSTPLRAFVAENLTIPDSLEDDLREEARQMAEDDYNENPVYMYSLNHESGIYEIIGNDDSGYTYDGGYYRDLDDAMDAVRRDIGEHGASTGEAQFAGYTEDGGENYREIVLTVPDLTESGPNQGVRVQPFNKSEHFDIDNVVTHARVKDRTVDDEKVLFVEEIQSDLASYWRDDADPKEARAAARGLIQAQDRLDRAIRDVNSLDREAVEIGVQFGLLDADTNISPARVREVLMIVVDAREAGETLTEGSGPARWDAGLPRPGQDGYDVIASWLRRYRTADAAYEAARADRNEANLDEPLTPFEGELAYTLMLKHLLRVAANEDADHLAWTPGYMQARRWSGAVQNVVKEVNWNSTLLDDETTLLTEVVLGATTEGATVARNVVLRGVNGDDVLGVDAGGAIVRANGARIPADQVVGKKLSDLIGGTMAQRVLDEESGSIEGENIVIGGDGYKIAYDQVIKKFVEKFAKRYGSKVEVRKDIVNPVTAGDVRRAYDRAVEVDPEAVLAYARGNWWNPEWWAELEDRVGEDLAETAVAARRSASALQIELDQIQRAGPPDAANPAAFDRAVTEFQRKIEAAMRRAAVPDDPVAVARITLERATTGARSSDLELLTPPEFHAKGDAVWSVRITDEMRSAAREAQPLFQKRPDGARGQILLPTAEGQAPVVTLFEKSDLSTFLHETGHYFLHMLQDMHGREDTPQAMRDDWETIVNWWRQNTEAVAKEAGVDEATLTRFFDRGTTGDAEVDRAINVALQEQWARAFEVYLLEGKAPTNALRAAFEAFSAWLQSIYRSAKGLNVTVSDELRGVFDRMIATDEEIAAAKPGLVVDDALLRHAEALGIDADQVVRLVRLGGEAQDEAMQRLRAAIMAPIRAAFRADYRAERDQVREDMAAKVNAKPANRAREWLGNRRWLGADQPVDLPADLRLDRQMLLDEYGEDMLRALPRGKFPIYRRGSGLSADDVAGWFGYKSGADMLHDMATSPRAEDEIRARTAAEMRRRHQNDPLSDGTVEQEAIKALHGDKRGQLIEAELRALGSVSGGRSTSRRQAMDIARRTLRTMPIRRAVRSGEYLAAERRAGERAALAMARGDAAAAHTAKREQLLNHALYRESLAASEVLAKVERKVSDLKKKTVREKLAGEYLEAIDAILDKYDFRKGVTQRRERSMDGLRKYIEMMTEAGRENELAIPSHVLEEAARRPYRTLGVAELEGVLDSLLNIEHTARMKQKLRDKQRERDLQAVVDGVVQEMDDNLSDRPAKRVATPGDKRRRSGRDLLDLLLNADTLLREIGGYDLGAAYDAIKAPIDAAAAEAEIAREKAATDMDALYAERYSRADMRRMAVRKRHDPLGDSFSQWDLISAALNMGNADNLARLMDRDSGMGFTSAQVEYIKSQLDRRDWEFVQSVWDYIETFWPQIEARERRVTGTAPRKVNAVEVETPHGRFSGGYYPIKYRSDVSAKVASEELVEVQQRMLAGRFAKAQTRHGHLEERAQGSGGRVLLIDISVFHQHIGQVIHDLAFNEAVTASWRVLQHKDVRAAFERKGRLADHAALEMWLQDTAVGQIVGGGALGKMMLRLKNGFTLSKLAFNLSTVAVQLTGLAQTVAVVGPRNFTKGMSTYLADRDRTVAELLEVSPMMRQRENTFNKDINDILNDVAVGPTASRYQRGQQAMAQYGFWLMQKVQFYAVDVPTWYAGYHQAIAKGKTEAEAYAEADHIVGRAQASGRMSDRSAIERGSISRDTRGNGFVRLFTTLGSYMFAKANVAYEIGGRTIQEVDGLNAKSLRAMAEGTASFLLLFTLEAILYNAIKGTLPGADDDDDEGWGEFLAKETVFSMAGTVPVLRDLVGSVQGFETGAYASALSSLGRPIVQGMQGEADLALFKALSDATGTLTGYPSGQLNRIVDAWYRSETGENVAPVEYIMGRR